MQFMVTRFRPAGTTENSPQFQLWAHAAKKTRPGGAADKTGGGNSIVPPGLGIVFPVKPAVETAGYFHPSYRGFAALR